jgi:hypothetical protein
MPGADRVNGSFSKQFGHRADQTIRSRDDMSGKIRLGQIRRRAQRQPPGKCVRQAPVVGVVDLPPAEYHEIKAVRELIVLPQGVGDLHLTHRMMISRSKWRPANSSSKPRKPAIVLPSAYRKAGG